MSTNTKYELFVWSARAVSGCGGRRVILFLCQEKIIYLCRERGQCRMRNYSQDNFQCNDHCIESMVGFVLEGVLILIISIFGIIGTGDGHTLIQYYCSCSGNITCLFVFNHKSVDLKPSFSNILKCLSIFDILFLVRFPLINFWFDYKLTWCLPPQLSSSLDRCDDAVQRPQPLGLVRHGGGAHHRPLHPPRHPDCHDGQCVQRGGRGCGEIFQHLQTFQSKLGEINSAWRPNGPIISTFIRFQCGMYQGFGYIVVIILFSLSYNILKFFELETVYLKDRSNDTDLCLTESSILSNESFAESRLTERWDCKQVIWKYISLFPPGVSTFSSQTWDSIQSI